MFWEHWPFPCPRGQRMGGGFPPIPAKTPGLGWGSAPLTEHLPNAGALLRSLSVFKMAEGIKLFILAGRGESDCSQVTGQQAQDPLGSRKPQAEVPSVTPPQHGGTEWRCRRLDYNPISQESSPAALGGAPRLYPNPATEGLTPSPGDLL